VILVDTHLLIWAAMGSPRLSEAARAAIDFLVEHAKPISVEQAQARDKLWTPDKEESPGGAGPQLWTPGS